VKPFSFGEINLTAGGQDAGAAVPPESPFCVAIIGDFSGRGRSEPGSVGTRRALLVDRDNFDEVLAKLGVEVHLPLGDEHSPVRLGFSELDDFHPDRIFERAEMFQRLRELRSRLSDPSTFRSAAAELGLATGHQLPSKPHLDKMPTPMAPAITRLASGSLLDESIEQTEGQEDAEPSRRAPDELREFVRRVTEPHLVVSGDELKAQAVEVIDKAASSLMRALLHSPEFQALEAAWRAVFLLVRRIETSPQLKLYLIDVSKQELAADLGSSEDLRSTGAYRLFEEKSVGTPGAEPWAIILGNYSFGPSREDAKLLARIASLARAAGAPFIAGATSRLLGCPSFASTPHPRDWKMSQDADGSAAWADLRRMPEVNGVGLALPRFLLRLPYGQKTSALESFDFEEMSGTPLHEDYLWGNAAFACALLLAQSFSAYGWQMRAGVISDIDGLPLHVYQPDGEPELKPCAEALLTEEAAERILENGLMPLVSFKGKDLVRLVRFQSIAEPPRSLAGRLAS
jgi:type VI secretion system protein ImpC